MSNGNGKKTRKLSVNFGKCIHQSLDKMVPIFFIINTKTNVLSKNWWIKLKSKIMNKKKIIKLHWITGLCFSFYTLIPFYVCFPCRLHAKLHATKLAIKKIKTVQSPKKKNGMCALVYLLNTQNYRSKYLSKLQNRNSYSTHLTKFAIKFNVYQLL